MYFKNIIILSVIFLASGCAGPVVINYAPSSTMTVEGELKVGDFRYIPAEEEGIKPNQLKNTALGEIILEKNIDEYIETALFTESRFVGIKLTDSAKVITGDIKEFLVDDLGYSIDWTLDIRYVISDCYDKSHKLEKNTDKFSNPFGALNEVVKLNIEMLFNDFQFKECIKN